MTYDLFLTWRNLVSKPVQAVVPTIIVALGIALSIAVLALGVGVRQGIIDASDPFGVLVVGPNGDGQQLVLNTILLQGNPLGTIPYDVYERLADDPRVRFAVPMAKGDNVAGFGVIGVNQNFFALSRDQVSGPAFRLAQGETFSEPFDAVLGSEVAAALGYDIGDTFQAAHGTGPTLERDIHDEAYTVVGVLEESNTPYDSAIFTPLESIWLAHSPEDPADEDGTHAGEDGEHAEEGATAVADADATPSFEDEIIPLDQMPSRLEGLEAEDQSVGGANRLTSVLVAPAGFVEQNQIWQDFYVDTQAQAVFPGQQLGRLFDLLQQAEQVLTVVGYLVMAIAGMTLFLSIYSVTRNQQHEIAIMRSVGGSRLTIFRVVMFEALALTLIGAILGRLIGYGVAGGIAAAIARDSGIPIGIQYLTDLEPTLWVITLVVGVVAGLVPAMLAYQVDVVENLFSS